MRKRKQPEALAAGPRSCLRSRHVTGACPKCGAPMEPAHSPLYLPGLFCAACCPCCNPAPVGAGVRGAATIPARPLWRATGHQGANTAPLSRSRPQHLEA